MVNENEKMAALKAKKEAIEKRLAALEARQKSKMRKDETRLKVLVGVAVMAEAAKNPETMKAVRSILNRTITAKRDRDFLQAQGWISAQPETFKE